MHPNDDRRTRTRMRERQKPSQQRWGKEQREKERGRRIQRRLHLLAGHASIIVVVAAACSSFGGGVVRPQVLFVVDASATADEDETSWSSTTTVGGGNGRPHLRTYGDGSDNGYDEFESKRRRGGAAASSAASATAATTSRIRSSYDDNEENDVELAPTSTTTMPQVSQQQQHKGRYSDHTDYGDDKSGRKATQTSATGDRDSARASLLVQYRRRRGTRFASGGKYGANDFRGSDFADYASEYENYDAGNWGGGSWMEEEESYVVEAEGSIYNPNGVDVLPTTRGTKSSFSSSSKIATTPPPVSRGSYSFAYSNDDDIYDGGVSGLSDDANRERTGQQRQYKVLYGDPKYSTKRAAEVQPDRKLKGAYVGPGSIYWPGNIFGRGPAGAMQKSSGYGSSSGCRGSGSSYNPYGQRLWWIHRLFASSSSSKSSKSCRGDGNVFDRRRRYRRRRRRRRRDMDEDDSSDNVMTRRPTPRPTMSPISPMTPTVATPRPTRRPSQPTPITRRPRRAPSPSGSTPGTDEPTTGTDEPVATPVATPVAAPVAAPVVAPAAAPVDAPTAPTAEPTEGSFEPTAGSDEPNAGSGTTSEPTGEGTGSSTSLIIEDTRPPRLLDEDEEA